MAQQQSVTKEALERMVTLQKGYIDSGLANKQNSFTVGNGLSLENNILRITLDHTPYRVVTELPATPADADRNKIFLVLKSGSESLDDYDEYLWAVHADGDETWEKIGSESLSVDLTPYAKINGIRCQKFSDLNGQGVNLLREENPAKGVYFSLQFAGSQFEDTDTTTYLSRISLKTQPNVIEDELGLFRVRVNQWGIITELDPVDEHDITAIGFSTTTAMTQAIAAAKKVVEDKVTAEITARTEADATLAATIQALSTKVDGIEAGIQDPLTVEETEALFNKVYNGASA